MNLGQTPAGWLAVLRLPVIGDEKRAALRTTQQPSVCIEIQEKHFCHDGQQ
jgi:hypothetical protein